MAPDGKSLDQIYQIPIKDIFVDDNFNSRGHVTFSDVVDLQRNIDLNGLLQPVAVQPYDKKPPYKYRLIIGHRRLAAIKMMKWETIPATIKEGLSETDAFALNFIENVDRQDLNMVQEAKAIHRFIIAGWTQKEIGKKIGKSTGWVNIRCRLLELDQLIQNEAAAGVLTQEQVKDIAGLPSKERQFQAIRDIKESRARGEKRALKVKKPKKNLIKRKDRDIVERREMLGHILDKIGPCVATRILAWTNGDITTMDLYKDLKEYADSVGKRYSIPRPHDAELTTV